MTAAITRAPLPPRRWIRIGLRVAGLALLLVVLATVHIRTRPATVCLLRALTGVPCPLCGGTTAASDLGRGDVPAALAASPLAVGVLVLAPVAGIIRLPFVPESGRLRVSLLLAVLAAAELWQLARFGLL